MKHPWSQFHREIANSLLLRRPKRRPGLLRIPRLYLGERKVPLSPKIAGASYRQVSQSIQVESTKNAPATLSAIA